MPDSDIIIDTLQKRVDHGHGLFGYCLACQCSFDISLPALIAERGGNSPGVRMKRVRCPQCGAHRASHHCAEPRRLVTYTIIDLATLNLRMYDRWIVGKSLNGRRRLRDTCAPGREVTLAPA